MCYSFGEGIEKDGEEGGNGVEAALVCVWELEEDGEAGEELDAEEGCCGEGGYGASGDGAEGGAVDVGVEVAVPEVVDCAAGAAHY